MSTGTNDFLEASIKAPQSLANLEAACKLLVEQGITPIHVGIRPRHTSVSVQQFKQEAKSVNKGLEVLARKGLLLFVDCTECYADNSTAFGNILPATSYDLTHQNSYGACLEGIVLADQLRELGFTPGIKFATSQDDVFHRVNNPHGCIGAISSGVITANPLLQGGTTAPTGTATVGGTWSKVNRTLRNGQVRTDARVALAASTTHTFTVDCIATGAFTSSQLKAGDLVEGVCLIKLGNGAAAAGINRINLQVISHDGVTSFDFNDLQFDLADTSALPLLGTEYFYLRTPLVPVMAWAGSGNGYIRTRLNIGTTAAGAGNIDVMAFETRPVSLVP